MLSMWPDEAASGLHQLRGTPLTQHTTLPSPALLQRHLHGVHYSDAVIIEIIEV